MAVLAALEEILESVPYLMKMLRIVIVLSITFNKHQREEIY
jgi:hypothetical protein